MPEFPAATADGEHYFHSLDKSWQSPLTHTTQPLSQNVPLSIKQKIWQHQFVDVHSLLTKTSTPKKMKLEVDPAGGYIVCATANDSHPPISIEKWTSAFIIFSAVYLEQFLATHPHKALELLEYMDTIRYAAITYSGRGWVTYDEHIRKTWSSPSVPFNQMQGEFWLKFISASPTHSNYNPPAGRTCFDFNKGSCNRNSCIFRHSCSACGSNRHPACARACSQSQTARPSHQAFHPRPANQPFRQRFTPRQNTPRPFSPTNPTC